MLSWLIYIMIYLGSILMVYSIFCFARFVRYVKGIKSWKSENRILYIPLILLVMFLIGYVAIACFGNPDIIIAGVLFGGSLFVYIMYRLLNRITRQIVQNERLEADLIAVERSNEAKTAFLATISHEMRTPMNVILGLDDLALKNPALQDDTRRQLEKIGQSGKLLLGLINDILDVNRFETGGLTITNHPFSLKDMLSQIDAVVRTMCEEKNLQYRMTVDGDADRWFAGDQTQLERVLLSVLDNAVKYTESPGSVCFAISQADAGDRVALQFAVTDTGVGMDQAFLPKIFGLFSQEDESFTNRYGGSGLSLRIAKNIIDEMGGTISVISKKGVGSTFTVTVPLEPVEAPEQADDSEATLPALEGRRILIVEDLPENAEIVADLLELEGAESEHAENGQIALQMIGDNPEGYYDAVLMDLRMPEMDGLTSTRNIRRMDRSEAKTMPIIALTANTAEIDIQHCLESGMDAHLSKPVDADLLYRTIRQSLRSTHSSQGGDKA